MLFWLFTTAAGATSLSSLLTSGMLDGDDCLLVKQGASLEVDVDFTIDRMEVLGTVTVVPPAPGDTRLISANQIIVGRKGKDGGAFLADMSSNPQVPVALGISLDANPRDPCTEWTLDGTGALAQAGTVTDNRPGLLWVTENGQLSLVGADPGETWTHLQQTVSTQDTTMTVPAHLGWPDNPKVVVAPTDFKKGEAEVFALSSVMGQEETWSLGTAAKHEHYHDTHGNVTLSGEVGLLTRNISVRGQVAPPSTAPDCSESDRKHLAHLEFDGAEIAVEPNMGTAAAELAYIEVVNGGKFDQLGHYPVHFHHGGDQSESFVRGLAVYRSSNRGIVGHGVKNLVIEDNVVFDVLGHGYYLEEGMHDTMNNTVQRNLAVAIHGCPREDGTDEPNEEVDNTHDKRASGFYFTDGRNTFLDNAVAGAHAAGFWWDGGGNLCGENGPEWLSELGEGVRPPSYKGPDNDGSIWCTGAFSRNTAHSSWTGLFAEAAKDTQVRIRDFKAYKNTHRGLWMRNHDVTEYLRYHAADNGTALWQKSFSFHVGNHPSTLMVDSEIHGETVRSSPQTYGLEGPQVPMYGVEIYNGRTHIARTRFENFVEQPGVTGPRAAFGRHQTFPFYANDPDNAISEVTFTNANPLYLDGPQEPTNDAQDEHGAQGWQSVALHDIDGSIAGDDIPVWYLANDDFLVPQDSWGPLPGVDFDVTANAWKVDAEYGYGHVLVEWCADERVDSNADRCNARPGNTVVPSLQWELGEQGAGIFDIVGSVLFVDELECASEGAQCTDVVDAYHPVNGRHNIAAATVYDQSVIGIHFMDQPPYPALLDDLSDIRALQVHYTSAPVGASSLVTVDVPEVPQCVVFYDDASQSVAKAGWTDGTSPAAPHQYVYADGTVSIHLANPPGVSDEQSALISFGADHACPATVP